MPTKDNKRASRGLYAPRGGNTSTEQIAEAFDIFELLPKKEQELILRVALKLAPKAPNLGLKGSIELIYRLNKFCFERGITPQEVANHNKRRGKS